MITKKLNTSEQVVKGIKYLASMFPGKYKLNPDPSGLKKIINCGGEDLDATMIVKPKNGNPKDVEGEIYFFRSPNGKTLKQIDSDLEEIANQYN